MNRRRRVAMLLAVVVGLAAWVGAQESARPVAVANGGFEQGGAQPAGWALSGGQGSHTAGDGGGRAVTVKGDGKDSNYWRSDPLEMKSNSVYRVAFRGRGLGASGGTAISGPVFANCDRGTLSEAWQTYGSVFRTPRDLRRDESWLRFGQWQVNGQLAFDNVEVTPVQPVYAAHESGLALGEGERLQGSAYSFTAPYGGESGNESRPLVDQRCYYNTNRWAFGADSDVVYRHQLPQRLQTKATIEVTVGWYAGGELVVQAGVDGKTWRDLGTLDALKSASFDVPADLLPTEAVWVRLTARAKQKVGANSDPGSLQVHGYTYRANVSGPALDWSGATRFVAVRRTTPGLDLKLVSLGEGLPGGRNAVAVDVAQAPAGASLVAEVSDERGRVVDTSPVTALAVGRRATLPYKLPDAGTWVLRLRSAAGYEAETTLSVAELHRSGYGEVVPGSTEQVGLWWCSSGWKVSRGRPLPAAKGSAVTIRAARNEAEAAQLVIRPTRDLRGLKVVPGVLRGPNGATLPADRMEVLRARYVEVRQPTDGTGTPGMWPDPLPPLGAGLDLPGGSNQPLWLRVKVPAAQAKGVYRGTVALSAEGWQASVPVEVEVFGFTLPDTMTCQTAFGFSPQNAFDYQKVTDAAQQRLVLDKYLRNYSEHHISPYNPAPLDGLKVSWKGGGSWQGGERDTAEKHGGQYSRKVVDASPNQTFAANYEQPIAIPAGGVKLSFWYKTKDTGAQALVTLGHRDANDAWMSGRNNDMPFTGDGTWQHFERDIPTFPEGAKAFTVGLWATLWSETGAATGTTWYDDLAITALTGGKVLLTADFEAGMKPEDLKPTFDFTAWDKGLAKAFDEYHFTGLAVPVQGLGGGTFFSRVEPELLGFRAGTPEFEAAFTAYWRGIEDHLRAKGWLDKTYTYWFDEPDPKDYEFVMAGMKRLKQAAPGIRRMLTEQVEPELVGGPNLWCPISNEFKQAPADQRMAAGDQFWWYVCTGPKAPYCTLFIDHPGTELRTWLWQTWQRRISGILVWESTYWTSPSAYPTTRQNPYEDCMSWVSGYDTAVGTKQAWGNGDGRFVYPPELAAGANPAATVLDGPVDSQRWEMLRDGIEDYEYLAMLKRAVAKLPAAQRAPYEALLTVPAAITTDAVTFTRDPAPIEARRLEVARALERIGQP
ncbi:MAG: DUF4091 domain-containing protein [Armatimonadetes bacterium]|nr:DUF4091 domain-containing protein [Armatimonadota bacterium]